jgi:hypothetical protein
MINLGLCEVARWSEDLRLRTHRFLSRQRKLGCNAGRSTSPAGTCGTKGRDGVALDGKTTPATLPPRRVQ